MHVLNQLQMMLRSQGCVSALYDELHTAAACPMRRLMHIVCDARRPIIMKLRVRQKTQQPGPAHRHHHTSLTAVHTISWMK